MEDAPVGVAAGKAAGAFVVALARPHPPAELLDADVVVHHLGDVAIVLRDPPRRRPGTR